MTSITEPSKFVTPFAESGLKNTIPPASNNTTGKAGFDKGFPERTMLPKASGGIPPSGMDFNGILYDITSAIRYMQSGGKPTYDAAFAAAIGGYPSGAVLIGDDGVSVFQNAVAGNETDPNSGGAGWTRPDLQMMELHRRSYAEAGYNVVGTFQAGFTIVNANDVGIDEATGKGYTGPAGPVAAGTDPASGGFVDQSGSLVNAFVAAYLYGNVGDELDAGPSPVAFGGVPGGIVDASSAIASALALHRSIDLRGRVWKISSTVIIPDGCSIDMRGADIIADTGSNPLFQYGVGGKGLHILHGGGSVSGTATAFLRAVGSTNTPTDTSQYARNIRLSGLYISSPTIDWFIDAVDAVRQVFIDSCYSFTKNGIRAIGKCVEWKFNKNIMFSSVGGVGTHGLILQSPGGGSAYNEGWHFTDCTLDNFEKNQIDDIFVFTWNGGYLGTKTVFGQPTTTHCREIAIGKGSVLRATVEFTPVGTHDYRASIEPSMFTALSGNCVIGNDGACGISVDSKFVSSVDGATAVRFIGNNSNCNVVASADATYDRVASFEGAYGPRCSYLIREYLGGSNAVYTEHPVRCISQPVTNSVSAAQVQNFVGASGTFAVGSNIATLPISMHKGDRGSIIVSVSISGGSTAVSAQRVVVTPPAGMVIPSGPGWDSRNIRPQFGQGMLFVEIPFYCSSDISSANLTLTNSSGNTLTVDSHGFFGYSLK